MTLLLHPILTAIGYLSLPLLHAAGWGVGAVYGWLPSKQKRIAQAQLDLCLPELPVQQRKRLARGCLRHMSISVFEAPAIWFGPERRLRRWLDDGAARAQLQAAARAGPLILLCPHIGAWELAGMFCASAGRMTSLYKPQPGALDGLIRQGRERLGAQLVPTAGSGIRALFIALKRREMIGALPDHDPPEGSGEFAPLFGIAAHTTSLPTKLAARTGARVWFCYAERLDWGRGFRIHLQPAPSGIADPVRGIAALNAGVEAVLRHLPEQYWWSHPRFRRRPAGEPPFEWM